MRVTPCEVTVQSAGTMGGKTICAMGWLRVVVLCVGVVTSCARCEEVMSRCEWRPCNVHCLCESGSGRAIEHWYDLCVPRSNGGCWAGDLTVSPLSRRIKSGVRSPERAPSSSSEQQRVSSARQSGEGSRDSTQWRVLGWTLSYLCAYCD